MRCHGKALDDSHGQHLGVQVSLIGKRRSDDRETTFNYFRRYLLLIAEGLNLRLIKTRYHRKRFRGVLARMGDLQSVLVTGGAGYIGSYACKVLARVGYRPVVFDNLSRGHRETVRWGPFVQGDLADREAVATALRTYRVSAALHLATSAYSCLSVRCPA